MKIKFTIPGEPKGKGRHRTTKTGHTYTPQDTVNYENWVKQCFVLEHKQKSLEGEIRATIHAYLQIPKSATKGKKLAMEHNIVRPTKKPDCDNIVKAILDSLNGIAYKDDSSVVDLIIQKLYSHEPRVEVTLEQIKLEGIKC